MSLQEDKVVDVVQYNGKWLLLVVWRNFDKGWYTTDTAKQATELGERWIQEGKVAYYFVASIVKVRSLESVVNKSVK